MKSEAQLIRLEDYNPELAHLGLQASKLLPSRNLWIRSRQWREKSALPRKFSVAVVGSRKPSAYGVKVTEELIRRLGVYDFCVVSGGAFGIDRIAHEVAIEEGLATRAWLVGPIEDPSPRAHRQLFDRIEKSPASALLVPEHLEKPERGFGSDFGAYAWLARNAWIAADADAVVVIEAYEKSGTWQTVSDANELGKMIYAVPGSIFTGTSYGTNKMISGSCAQAVYDLDELTESLVVLAGRRSYNIIKGPQEAGHL
jgi:DNA processing protein